MTATKAQRRAEKAAAKAMRRAIRARSNATVRRPVVHLFVHAHPPVACGPDGLRRVDQHHAHSRDPLAVTCPGCKATPFYGAVLAAASSPQPNTDLDGGR